MGKKLAFVVAIMHLYNYITSMILQNYTISNVNVTNRLEFFLYLRHDPIYIFCNLLTGFKNTEMINVVNMYYDGSQNRYQGGGIQQHKMTIFPFSFFLVVSENIEISANKDVLLSKAGILNI